MPLILVYTNIYYTSNNIYISNKKQAGETVMKETLTFTIEKELKIELKVLAVRQEKSLTQLLNEIITTYVDENK